MNVTVSKPDTTLEGEIVLDGSKSIGNRVLIIRALCGTNFYIDNLSTSLDTRLLQNLLASDDEVLDAGDAGTTFRFLAAFLAAKGDNRILTGSQRMKQRPIAPLVEALRQLGAGIRYLENEGYPPIEIRASNKLRSPRRLSLQADVSSQFISALALIAPVLPGGLKLELEGEIVSRPYIEMTLKVMEYFGVSHAWKGKLLDIPPQGYRPCDVCVEADWSAASYYYAMGAFSKKCSLRLVGLSEKSWQADAVLPVLMKNFGIETIFQENGVLLKKSGVPPAPRFVWDFLPCPDIAQTLAVVCSGLGVRGLFTGLDTLSIKETDRIAALQQELAKVKVALSPKPARTAPVRGKMFYSIEGKANLSGTPAFHTYGDHRMAMALATLSMLGKIQLEEPGVVEKSYPAFWKDLEKLGFILEPQPAV